MVCAVRGLRLVAVGLEGRGRAAVSRREGSDLSGPRGLGRAPSASSGAQGSGRGGAYSSVTFCLWDPQAGVWGLSSGGLKRSPCDPARFLRCYVLLSPNRSRLGPIGRA